LAGTILTIQQSYTYNASSQLKSVSNSSNVTIADFRYDASGMRVLSKVNGVKTIRIGGIYEKEITGTGATAVTKVTKYYDGVALRVGSGTLQYLHRDHLGGVIAITDSSGAITRQERYKPFGETLWSAGTNTPTTQAYTGQKRESSFGLYDYNARWYDAALGRFTQADSIVPNPASAKSFDRYAYVENNPVRYNDPSGHCIHGSSGTVYMNQYPYGTSGICPSTKPKTSFVLVSNQAAMERENDQYNSNIIEMNGGNNFNACGLVAVAGALYAPGSKEYLAVIESGTKSEGGYSNGGGIQPRDYTKWVVSVLAGSNLRVRTAKNQTIGGLETALANGYITIVDISVAQLADGSYGIWPISDHSRNNFAHFARILGIDKKRRKIIIEKTLPDDYFKGKFGDATWEVDFDAFMKAWGPNVETGVESKSNNAEPGVTNWALYISP
jgi:RHS repeat-associated protein